MSGIAWSLVEFAARLLEREEREAVLGDLEEAGESPWRSLLDVGGLTLRRQAGLWKEPRPWLAGFLVTVPCSYLLTHVSMSVTYTYERVVNHKVWSCIPTGHEGILLMLCHIFLLIAWSWSAGYVMGAVSRLTLWASALLAVVPPAYYLSKHELPASLRLCVFLFVLPAILGARQSLRKVRLNLGTAAFLAVAITGIMIFAWGSDALWIFNWALIGPAWYLVARAWRSGREPRTGPWTMGPASYTRGSQAS
jgi:hypothetical protein